MSLSAYSSSCACGSESMNRSRSCCDVKSPFAKHGSFESARGGVFGCEHDVGRPQATNACAQSRAKREGARRPPPRLTVLHELDAGDDPLGVLPRVAEALLEQRAELGKLGRVESAEDVDIVLRELERRHLEPDRAGRVAQHEAKVDVCPARFVSTAEKLSARERDELTDEVALAVDEDVAVVSVFELQEVADDRVRRQALDKGVLRFPVPRRVDRTVRLLDQVRSISAATTGRVWFKHAPRQSSRRECTSQTPVCRPRRAERTHSS